MKILDRFTLRSFMGPFIMTFSIVIFVLVMNFLWLYIDELVGKGLGIKIIAEFLAWGSATLIPYALPLATLLASIMTLGNLGENNELLALKAAGISLPRILRPLIIVAAIISIGAFFASNNLIPVSYQKIYTLREDINKTKEEIKIPTGIFYDGIENYTMRVGSRNKRTHMMYDIMVYNHTAEKGNVSLTIADSGMIKLSHDKKGVAFSLYQGTTYEETNNLTYRDTSLALQKINFSYQEVVIPLENYAFERTDDNRYGNEVMAKNLKQLKKDKDSLATGYNETITTQLAKLKRGINLKYSRDFDTLFNKRLASGFDSYVMYDSLPLEKKIESVKGAIQKISSPASQFNVYEMESRLFSYPLRRTIVESFRKFSLSMACLIFFFIGAPLGAIIRKGGLGTPMIISVLFFVYYWVIDIIGKKLADDGVISPFIGAFVSTFALLPIGIFLTYKSTKDSALFNTDTYIIKIKKFTKRIQAFFGRK